MSNTLVIAAVTAMLKDILENRLANHPVAIGIGDLLVTALPPDRITVGSDERPQLNVFLYQISQNRNADWIERDQFEKPQGYNLRNNKGKSSDQALLALDLHYLITAYGAKDFQAELLLGYAMQVLHNIPVMTRDMVHTALKHAAAMTTFGALSQVLATLSIEDLADQVGAIKLCPEFFSMEETSKLWSSLQTHYRPSAGYQASMALLDRPTAQSSINATASLSLPTIDRLESASIHPGDQLTLHGQQLQGSLTYLRISERLALLSPQTVEPDRITLLLPPDLPAGVHSIQVVQIDPAQRVRSEIQSNRVAFNLQPAIRIQQISVHPLLPDRCQVDLSLAVKPLIHPAQHLTLLLTPCSDCSSPLQLPVPASDVPLELLTIPLQIPAGHYWLQLQVDGMRSQSVEIEVNIKVNIETHS